jgi:hypothetical protein
VFGARRDGLRSALGAAVCAAAALGFANQAAHQDGWSLRTLGAALGLLGAVAAVRLSAGRLAGPAWNAFGRPAAGLLAALLPLAARLEGRELWIGSAWAGSAGAAVALAAFLAGRRGAWVAGLAVAGAGATGACFHPWTAAWAGVVGSALLALEIVDRKGPAVPRSPVIV